MLFYCQNCTFISRSALLFSGIVLLFFRSASLFLKNVLSFSRISLQFPRSDFLLFTVHIFFQECFFFQLIVPCPGPAQSCSERSCLPYFCFISSWSFLLTNLCYFPDNLETSTWSMIFMCFIQILATTIAWKMQFLSILAEILKRVSTPH